MRRPRIVLADDHTLVAEGFRAVLAAEFEVAAVAKDGRELLNLSPQLKPDVIVLDISMPVLNGIDAACQIKKELPKCKIIFMSGHEGHGYIRAAFRVGASGYVLKSSAAEELVSAIHQVLHGGIHLPEGVQEDILSDTKQTESPLSPREREVLQLVAEGKSAKEVGGVLNLSQKTVEFHKYNIMNKLGIRTTAELARYAVQQGLVAD